MNSDVTLVLLLLLVSAAVALAVTTNLRLFGWAEGFDGPTPQPRERVVEPGVQQPPTQRAVEPSERPSAAVIQHANAAD